MHTPSILRSLILLAAVLTVSSPPSRAQGPLTPPGAPAPTMKSPQEIWDKVGTLETTVGTLQTQNQTLQQQVTGLQKDSAALGLLLANANIVLPWQISTVDSTGTVGQFASLAISPTGQPAISYYDGTNFDLKGAVLNGSAWSLSTLDSTGTVGTFPSLAFSPSGQPAISYWDNTGGDLKYAVFSGSTGRSVPSTARTP